MPWQTCILMFARVNEVRNANEFILNVLLLSKALSRSPVLHSLVLVGPGAYSRGVTSFTLGELFIRNLSMSFLLCF